MLGLDAVMVRKNAEPAEYLLSSPDGGLLCGLGVADLHADYHPDSLFLQKKFLIYDFSIERLASVRYSSANI